MIGHAIKLRWLEYFAAVAEELHFGRAATRMHVSGSALSRQVRELEAALGVPLFVRTTRTVRLTAEGRSFYAQVRPALRLLDAGVEDLRSEATDDAATITVGFVSALGGTIMPAAVREFRKTYPRTRVRLEQVSSREQMERVAGGTLDTGLHWRLGDGRPPAPLRHRDVATTALHVALPDGHRLAGRAAVGLSELAGEDWLMSADGNDTELRDGLIELCRAHGFAPRIRNEATWISSLHALVAAGAGICGAPAGAIHPPAPGVVLRPIDGCSLDLVAVQPPQIALRAAGFVDHVIAAAAAIGTDATAT